MRLTELVPTVQEVNIRTLLVRLVVNLVLLVNIKINKEKLVVNLARVVNIKIRQLLHHVKIVQLVKLQKAPVNQVAKIVTGGIIRQQRVKTHVQHVPLKAVVGTRPLSIIRVILATVPIRLVSLARVEVLHLVNVVALAMAMATGVVRNYPIYVLYPIGCCVMMYVPHILG